MAPVMKHVKKHNKKNKFKPQLLKRKKKKFQIHEEIKHLQESYKEIDSSKIKTFSDFPLSKFTQKGLEENNYCIPTEIQRESIGLALQGEDILGAAQTGSGKTLAFLIPVLEILYCKQWTRLDGVGALIITPTRELAYQIFETLKKVGKHHDFSAGLIIGGKDLHFEKGRMDQCNIIICTPGRILHHMDVNPLFNCNSMEILILDEADRCLDLGFQDTMNSIIENLPSKRQTLLFSATQTKSVKDLARLSLKNPRYVSVHEHKEFSTPESLEQSYIVCELHDKINLLWSFIKNHKRQKILIFLSSCKQVKFVYLLFCRLRPGTPLLALYGSLHQLRRMKIYNEFCAKQNVVMFATDIAARGLDFPDVNWVLQLDCPEDANTYIHRAGRTARYRKGGESLLVLLPSEEDAMVEELKAVKIPINKIKVNPKKLISPTRKIEALVARDLNLKMDAQRAFVAYIKWVYLMKNKKIFRVDALNLEKFAASFGLAVTPRVRFLKGKIPDRKLQKEETQVGDLTMRDTSESESESEEKPSVPAAGSDEEMKEDWKLSEEEEDILTIKRRNHDLEDEPNEPAEEEIPGKKKSKIVTKAAIAKKLLKKKIKSNRKITFDEEGEGVADKLTDKLSKEGREYETEESGGIDIEKAKAVLKAEDKFDKKLFRERIKEKHKTKKKKLKEEKKGEEEEELKDDFGTDSESSGPDVSWLPDPDKVFQKKRRKEGDDDNDDDDDDDDDDGGDREEESDFDSGGGEEDDDDVDDADMVDEDVR